jgi:transglutaminase-like putative cysteine protease
MADYHIKHITRYTYASTVIDCSNQVMLYPVNDSLQIVKSHELKITDDPAIEIFTDFFENKIGVFSVVEPHNELTIQSDIVVSTTPVIMPKDDLPAVQQWEELNKMCGIFPYMDFMHREKFAADEQIKKLLTGIVDAGKSPLVNANNLSEYVYKNFEYKKGVTTIETKVDEILQLKAGVCQDFAHVLLVMLHMIGIPARYVSGYICPKNHELRGEGATHAWVEAYIPFYGWLGLDPTNNCIVSDRHVRLAIGRNFSDCTPVKGTYKGSSEHTLEVSVIINNGNEKKTDENDSVATFTYTSKNPAVTNNSYQRFLEMQQQQQ